MMLITTIYGRSFVDSMKTNQPNNAANLFFHKLQNCYFVRKWKTLPFITSIILIDRLDKVLNNSKTK